MIKRMNLSDCVLNELLPAKSGIDRHEKHHIHIVDQFLERVDRRTGIERNPRFAACRLDLLDEAMRMVCCLDVKRDDVRARLSKRLDVRLGVLNHEMYVKDRLGDLAEALHNTRAHRDIRHKRPVHHVDVDVLCPRLLHAAYICTEIGEICREERRRDDGRPLDMDVRFLLMQMLVFVCLFMFVYH